MLLNPQSLILPMPNLVKSAIPHFTWPAPLRGRGAELGALLYQYECSQWFPAQKILEYQLRQLKQVYDYALEYSPYYRKLFNTQEHDYLSRIRLEDWQKLPVSSRSDLEKHQSDVFASSPPSDHGNCYITSSSGSRGKPVTIKKTEICDIIWEAVTLRDHLWHGRDLGRKLAGIRWLEELKEAKTTGFRQDSWGHDDILKTGESVMMHCETPLDDLAHWLVKEKPEYIVSYPSILDGLAQYFIEHKLQLPSLKEASTFGELLQPSTREHCQIAWNIGIADIYSCNEAGYLALQCPEHEKYHVQSENVLVEILNEQNEPCEIGELGKVVVSSLNNFATPLLRYDTGDYAKYGEPCACGRGLPVLEEIAGRTRNLVCLPDGSKHRPAIGFVHFEKVAKVHKAQLLQRSFDTIEARLVVERPLSLEQEQSIIGIIQNAMNYPFKVELQYWDTIPLGARGKFEEFISVV